MKNEGQVTPEWRAKIAGLRARTLPKLPAKVRGLVAKLERAGASMMWPEGGVSVIALGRFDPMWTYDFLAAGFTLDPEPQEGGRQLWVYNGTFDPAAPN